LSFYRKMAIMRSMMPCSCQQASTEVEHADSWLLAPRHTTTHVMTTLSQLLTPPRAAACVARAHKWEDAYGRLRSAWPCPEPRGSWGCWQQHEWQRIAGRRRGSHCIAQALPVSRPPGLSSSRTPRHWHAPCPGFALSPTYSPSSPPSGTCGSSLVQRPELRRLRQKDDEVLN
jgi:hypothetical protein